MTKLPSRLGKNDKRNLRPNLRVWGVRFLRQLKRTDYSGPLKHDNVLFNHLPRRSITNSSIAVWTLKPLLKPGDLRLSARCLHDYSASR